MTADLEALQRASRMTREEFEALRPGEGILADVDVICARGGAETYGKEPFKAGLRVLAHVSQFLHGEDATDWLHLAVRPWCTQDPRSWPASVAATREFLAEVLQPRKILQHAEMPCGMAPELALFLHALHRAGPDAGVIAAFTLRLAASDAYVSVFPMAGALLEKPALLAEYASLIKAWCRHAAVRFSCLGVDAEVLLRSEGTFDARERSEAAGQVVRMYKHIREQFASLKKPH